MAPPSEALEGSGAHILVVDDDPDLSELFRTFLEGEGHLVATATSLAQARAHFEGEQPRPDLVTLDIGLGADNGLELLAWLSHQVPGLPVIVASSSRNFKHAVEALREGAIDYLVKPLSKEQLCLSVRNALRRVELTRELHARRALDGAVPVRSPEAVVGSRAMRLVISTLERVADSSVPVLLTGESGVGKEVAARWLHRAGRRRERPFVAVNCAAIPKDLVESELFGHAEGAFTGATTRRIGRFEEASGGTIFLDEIGELDLASQSKLLRALEATSAERVGGGSFALDARVVAATNRDLRQAVAAGQFRGDLYYRLEVITVQLPPLRERLEEIPLLAEHLLERFVAKEGLPPRQLSAAALGALAAYDWPGNVRELENLLKRAALLAPGPVLEPEHLNLGTRSAAPPAPGPPPRGPAEAGEALLRALAEAGGNVSAACRRLGIGRSTFYRRAKDLGLAI